jgi:hypothetical protein
VASVAGALLIGGLVWYALTSLRDGAEPASAVPAQAEEGVLAVVAAAGAQIVVDGAPVGSAPRELRVSPGTHRVRASHPDLGVAEATIEVVSGQRTLWNAPLAR